MRTLIAATITMLALGSQAQADNYLSVGVGSDSGLSGTMSSRFDTDDLSVGRLALGHRTGPIAIEAAVYGSDLAGGAMNPDFSSVAVGLDLKYHFGLLGPIEGYGRGGINKNWYKQDGGSAIDLDYAGRGYAVGGGVQYTFDVLPLVSASVWLDYSRHMLDLSNTSNQAESVSGTADLVTVGVSFGAGLL